MTALALAPHEDSPTLHDLTSVHADELCGLLARCSRRTLAARFLGCGSHADQLAEALSRTGSLVGLAARAGTTLIGVGSVDGPAPYELAILVEDRWQRRGIGTQLLTALTANAITAGAAALTVSLTVDNTAARHLVRALWPTARFTPPDAGVVDAVLPLRPNTVPAAMTAWHSLVRARRRGDPGRLAPPLPSLGGGARHSPLQEGLVRIALAVLALAASLAACTTAPSHTAGPFGPPPATTSPASSTTTAAPPGKVQTFAAAVIGRMNTGDGRGHGLTSTGESLLESTNTAGNGGIREVDPATGAPRVAMVDQPGRLVSGVAVTVRPGAPDTVWQLTHHENIAIARDRATLTPQRHVAYNGEGWGLCDDGTQLVHSDGTMRLTLRDATDFTPTGTIDVTGGWWTTGRLGELECTEHNGHRSVWANLAGTSWLLRIDLDAGGAVTAVADLSPALAAVTTTSNAEPINGIAAIASTANEFWVTGNGWHAPLRVRLTPRP